MNHWQWSAHLKWWLGNWIRTFVSKASTFSVDTPPIHMLIIFPLGWEHPCSQHFNCTDKIEPKGLRKKSKPWNHPRLSSRSSALPQRGFASGCRFTDAAISIIRRVCRRECCFAYDFSLEGWAMYAHTSLPFGHTIRQRISTHIGIWFRRRPRRNYQRLKSRWRRSSLPRCHWINNRFWK